MNELSTMKPCACGRDRGASATPGTKPVGGGRFRPGAPRLSLALALTIMSLLVLFAAGGGCAQTSSTPFPCPAADPAAIVEATGVYRYTSGIFALRGTISFSQTGNQVTVTGTTYDNADDRPLTGTAELRGNRLDVPLVPTNGETNYRADVSFVFGDGGGRFCVRAFSDTNGDTGGSGSYHGTRQLSDAASASPLGLLHAP